MEREQELAKLVNVLRKTSRMAWQSVWTGGSQDSAAYCVEQYNRVLARLKELDQSVATVFEPLDAGSSLTVAAMACRQLASYFEDEVPNPPRSGRGFGFAIDPGAFKDFWCKAGHDFEDLGEYIRESIEDWTRTRRPRPAPPKEEPKA